MFWLLTGLCLVIAGVITKWLLNNNNRKEPVEFQLKPEMSLPPKLLLDLFRGFIGAIDGFRRAVVPPSAQVIELMSSVAKNQMINLVVYFNIADMIPLSRPTSGWPTVDEIANSIRSSKEEFSSLNTDYLYRVLRALSQEHIFMELPGRRFTHSNLSLMMRKDHPSSLRSTITIWGTSHFWGWQGLSKKLLESKDVEPKKAAFEYLTNKSFWSYLNEPNNDYELKAFQGMFDDISRIMTPPLVWDFNWRKTLPVKSFNSLTICDCGGGFGGVLEIVLQAIPEAKGILFDQTPVIEKAKKNDRWKGKNIEFVGGSFLEESDIPDADVYILRMILHDWSDECSIKILKNIEKRMKNRPQPKLTRVIVIEQVLPPEGKPNGTILPINPELVDVLMMLMLDGKERTDANFETLFRQSGLKRVITHSTRSVFSLVEASLQ